MFRAPVLPRQAVPSTGGGPIRGAASAPRSRAGRASGRLNLIRIGAALLLVSGPTLGVSVPRLVADLGTEAGRSDGSQPHGMARIGDRVVFVARPDEQADRLFVTDGSTVGTAELAAPCGDSSGGEIHLAHAGPSRAFFRAACASEAVRLWVSDGTAAGTVELFSVGSEGAPPGIEESALWGLENWADLGDATYFLSGGGYSPLELWRVEDDLSGATRVWISSDSPIGGVAAGLAAVARERLVIVEHSFSYSEGSSIAFRASDGSAAGTILLRSIPTGAGGFLLPRFGRTESAVLAWFPSGASTGVSEVWISNGTGAGTERIATLNATSSWVDSYAGWKVEGNTAYFIASSSGRRSIWRTDGSAASTRSIVDLTGWASDTANLDLIGDYLVVLVCDPGDRNCEIRRAPKTGGVTEPLVLGCGATACDSIARYPPISRAGGALLFWTESEERRALWAIGADPASADPLVAICEGGCFERCVQRTGTPDYLFATSRDCQAPHDLWFTDGTVAGTMRLAGALDGLDFYDPGAGTGFSRYSDAGWVFRAARGGTGSELWRARRQSDSAVLLADLRADRPGLLAAEVVGEVAGHQILAVQTATYDTKLFRLHAANRELEELFTLPAEYEGQAIRPLRLREAGADWLFFSSIVYHGSGAAGKILRYRPESRELTVLFPDVAEDGIGATSNHLVPSGGRFLFLGTMNAERVPAIYEWRPELSAPMPLQSLPAEWAYSVGTFRGRWVIVEGGERLVSIDLGTLEREVLLEDADGWIARASLFEHGAVAVRGVWTAEEGEVAEVWRTDGSRSGTVRVGQVRVGTGYHCELYVEVSRDSERGAALFALSLCSEPAALWTTDGSVERTRALLALDGYPNVWGAALFRGERYFLADERDPETGDFRRGLWKTDATVEGTTRIAWLPEDFDDRPFVNTEIAAGSEAVYFPWFDAGHGGEIWRSDGSAAGTGRAGDIEPGAEGANPSQLLAVGDQVVFAASTSEHGTELWQIDGGLAQPALVEDLFPGVRSSLPFSVATKGETILFLADDGVIGRELWEIGEPTASPCESSPSTLCLAGGRFRARAVRRDFSGEMGAAGATQLTDDSGYFWFFDEENPELLLKMVDACGLPGFGNFWLFSTGLTNVEVELDVVDTESAERATVGTRLSEPFPARFVTDEFRVCDLGGSTGAPAVPFGATAPSLSLLGGRFEASVSWTGADGAERVAAAVPFADGSGYFWFFEPHNVEVVVKLFDACGLAGYQNYWLFAAGLTDLPVTLTVRDVASGESVTHRSRSGEPFRPLLETARFHACHQPSGAP